MITIDNIITGEKLQELADIYLGKSVDDFIFNPYINSQTNKHYFIDNITSFFDNPPIVFCYGHRLQQLFEKLHYFKNEFILISHNSDENIINNNIFHSILEFNLLKKWYAQNVCFNHPKLELLPIGMANRQWSHGNYTYFLNTSKVNSLHLCKSEFIYFYFNISTNHNARAICYNKLIGYIPFLNNIDPLEYNDLLSKYQFCICPEGNGVDTHRLWEALYLKTIPIVLKNDFIINLKNKTNLPMVILNNWDELINLTLNYNDFIFDDNYYYHISFENYKKKILSKI